METRTYSLWLIPGEPSFSYLRILIATLARAFNSPVFDPHVTLTWGEVPSHDEAVRRARLVAPMISSVLIQLQELATEDNYFKSLYFRIDPTVCLHDMHEKAQNKFTNPGGDLYRPHLSLMYGNVSSDAALVAAKRFAPEVPLQCQLARLYLLHTSGPVEEWKRLADFPLRRSI
jgi:Cyclic phosphodiesterase-like protein